MLISQFDVQDVFGADIFIWVNKSYTAINHGDTQQSSVFENAIHQVSPWSVLWGRRQLAQEMLWHLNHCFYRHYILV
jgi:hypothetical protein